MVIFYSVAYQCGMDCGAVACHGATRPAGAGPGPGSGAFTSRCTMAQLWNEARRVGASATSVGSEVVSGRGAQWCDYGARRCEGVNNVAPDTPNLRSAASQISEVCTAQAPGHAAPARPALPSMHPCIECIPWGAPAAAKVRPGLLAFFRRTAVRPAFDAEGAAKT